MTKSELKNRIRLQFAGAGHYNAFVTRYGKEGSILVTDMTLIDAIKSDEPCLGTTAKQALQIIYNKAK